MHDTNCPNCGAPIRKPVCEYCGTMLSDGGLVDHDMVELYADGEVAFVFDMPRPSEQMKRAIATGIMSVGEARQMLYG